MPIPYESDAMAETDGKSFVQALQGRVDETLDACTRCGKCVEACPMVEPAGIDWTARRMPAIVDGILDLLAGGAGTPDAERWAQVCTNSGKCIPACEYGINPRFMVNMARIAAKAKQGDAAVRRAAQQYFNTMGRGTRVISRLQLPPEVLARLNPPLRAAGEYTEPPGHRVLHRLQRHQDAAHRLAGARGARRARVSYEVMGGTSTCCGIQQFKQGDAQDRGPRRLQHDRAAERARARRRSSPGARAARSRSARWRCRPTRNRTARCRSS